LFTSTYSFDAESKIFSVNSGSGYYTYDAAGERMRKSSGGSFTEYQYLNGQPIAEKNSDGTWSDYIYANGQKIARADSFDARIHLQGTTTALGHFAAWYVPFSSYVIQPGDTLFWRQYQQGSQGGIGIYFSDHTDTGSTLDTSGQIIDTDATQNTWHERAVDLSPFEYKTATQMWLDVGVGTPVGSWNSYYGEISIVSTNGNVTPIYTRESSIGLTYFSNGNISNPQGYVEKSNSAGDSVQGLTTTTYYHGDHIGSTRMLTSAGGWPVSSDTFYPFGQEQSPNADPNHYKFTGKERDSESGLDYFGARYYGSNMGRWMSPDWSKTPEAVPYSSLDNPQSLNLYSYVKNNPLSMADPDGHNGFTDFFQRLGNVFRYGAFELTSDVINDERQYLVNKGVVTVNGTTGKVLDYSNATNGQIDSAFRSFRNSEMLSSLGLAAGAPMLGANGTQTTSKTLWEDGKEHIDVENPNPGQRPGQIHYQDGANKYIYNVESGEFEGLSSTQSKQLLSKPEVQQAIDKGLKYLGVSR
jgi:RHS repeat-associated protein